MFLFGLQTNTHFYGLCMRWCFVFSCELVALFENQEMYRQIQITTLFLKVRSGITSLSVLWQEFPGLGGRAFGHFLLPHTLNFVCTLLCLVRGGGVFCFFFSIQFLKVTFHLQLLQNADYIPHVVRYIRVPYFTLRSLCFPFLHLYFAPSPTGTH